MKTTYTIARLLALLAGLTGLLNMGSAHVYSSGYDYKPLTSHHDLAKVKESYARIPLSFVANYGQAHKDVKFISRGSGYSLALAPTTFTLAVANTRNKNNEESAAAIQATLLGGNAAAKLTGLERLITKTNYFIGSDPRRWKTNLPNYAKVKYSGVYPGVDLVFYGNQNLLEYDFTVSPGVDPRVITLGFDGITDMRVDEKGDLILRTHAGEIRQSRPVVYQQIDGARRMIPASYLIKGKKQIAFQIENYDRSKPLVIDPTLAFSTLLGGTGSDRGNGIAVDSAGNAYITGSTDSTNFPVTAGAFQTARAGLFVNDDAFVTKMNSTGTALIYSTYFGGDNRDAGNDIAVDGAGNAYITGLTEGGIPTTPGAFKTSPVGGDEFEAFAMKLNATGTALVYSTYLGPGTGSGITIDTAGNAYITGQAAPNFPTTPGAFQTVSGGSSDAFVTKLNSTGTAQVYSTFLGGSGFDSASEIAIDALGNAYVTGGADAGFPVTAGAFQTTFNGGGGGDAFVTKLNSTGTALVYSTFLGGSGRDAGLGIAVNSAGNAYVTGSTDSSNFPVTAGAFQSVTATGNDAFVTELSVAGNSLAYSTYLGGDGFDLGTDIAVDTAGNASVIGLTDSTNFPTADAIQSACGGNNDAFVTRLNPTGTGLVFSSYLGGSNSDAGFSIAVDAAGSIYLTGSTSSTDFPTTPGAFQTVFGGGNSDAFVTKIVFSNFDVCLVDDGNGDSFQFNSTTGEYKFTQAGPGGVTLTGTGVLSQQGCLLSLEDNQPGQKVKAHFNHCNNMGQAVIQVGSTTFVVTDKDTSNSDCP